MDSYASSIDEMTKMLFKHMKIGIMISDEMILQIAGSTFDESEYRKRTVILFVNA